jgi:hypothetical protein
MIEAVREFFLTPSIPHPNPSACSKIHPDREELQKHVLVDVGTGSGVL